MSVEINLSGKTALVTGGGTGLGKAAAAKLIEAGAQVFIAGRRHDVLEKAAADIGATAIGCDVADGESVARTVASVQTQTGGPDILVNAAGLNIRGDSFEYGLDDWDYVHAVNTRGLFACCQAAGRVMRDKGYGKIVNVASMASEIGLPNIVAYGSSKGAVRQITKGLAAEWAKTGIRVNGVEPGWFRTELTEPLFGDKAWVEKITNRIPMGYAGSPDELAGVILFLASPLSDYMTGELIQVDGGVLAS